MNEKTKDKTSSERVAALYGRPGFETWTLIGEALRMPGSSANTWANVGRVNATAAELEALEAAEWRLEKWQRAIDVITATLGVGRIVTSIHFHYTREGKPIARRFSE